MKLFLRAKTAGKFTAKLTMDPSGDPRVRVEGPAQEEMGVVELKLLVHEHDIPAIQAKKVDPTPSPSARTTRSPRMKRCPPRRP